MRLTASCLIATLAFVVVAPSPGFAAGLTPDGRAATVTAVQGVAVVRPVGRERWSPLDGRSVLFPGDVVRVEARGANALEARLAAGGSLVLGPGALVEWPAEGVHFLRGEPMERPGMGGIHLLRGAVEVSGDPKTPVHVTGPGSYAEDVVGTSWLRVKTSPQGQDVTVKEEREPAWLEGYRASTSEEWMGSLLANVSGRDVPLAVGYHKVTVEIRDQIARTTVEESFVNATDQILEGVFSFPLPADASISGFGMWIGSELVEADVVEKQRAREIYEDILRRKKDPGLLEWEGGNLFKARVYPIPPHADKRIRLRYTQVLPLEGEAYRYRYALRSELLRSHPLRELSMAVSVYSTAPIRGVTSATHEVTLRATEHEAVAEFSAQEYVPQRDFELAVTVGRGEGLSAVTHRRGDDGFFMLLLSPPDPAAAGWQRDLLPEGEPLDLILVADTSGSMDPAARAAQAQFLAALLAQLSPKDRFRLLACDVEPRWLVKDATPATEAEAAQALDALDKRFSLGWTDLDRAVEAVLAQAGPTTQVVYVGDGIPTAGEADPVATVDRARTRARETKATFHAVSTSSAYEKVVLEGLASLGGGSVRRGDEAPAAAAKALLTEIARPGAKDLHVEIQGVPTAKVYPEVLPNVPVGQQQPILGRFLPGAPAATATAVVTGTLAGKPVRYACTFATPAAGEGNSFLPRLWARRHLDALLAGGQDARTKETVVAFSREYQIMTPYTSFLVLENDEERARYGVERTVKMRDAEQFFAQARDHAALEVARRQMETARRWHVGLRRRMLAEIERLGRDLPIAVAWGWVGSTLAGGPGEATYDQTFSVGRTAAPLGLRARLSAGDAAGAEEGEAGQPEYLDRGVEMRGLGALPTSPAATPAPEPPGGPEEESPLFGAEGEKKAEDLAKSEAQAGEEGPDFVELEKVTDGLEDKPGAFAGKSVEHLAPRPGRWGDDDEFRSWRYPRRPAPWSAGALGFPDLGAPPKAPRPQPDPAWDPLAIRALRALDRRPALAHLQGALRIAWTREQVHPLRGHVLDRSRSTTLLSAREWHVVSDGFAREPYEAWVAGTERGVLRAGLRLGRRREATDEDRARAPLPLSDGSTDDLVRVYAAAYRRPPSVAREGDVVRLVFSANADPGRESHLAIDVARSVLLERGEVLDGRATATERWTDFVEAGGRWWPTKAETLDAAGNVVAREALRVEALDPAAFGAALAAATASHADAVFLGASEPDLATARQAVHDGRASLADRLVVALDLASRARWDDLAKAWEPVEALVAGKPGASWMRFERLRRGRRGPEALALATALARGIARDPVPAAPWLAQWLDGRTDSMGARERLALVDAVAPAWARGGPDADLWAPLGRRRRAEALTAAESLEEARTLRETLAKERPWDVLAVLDHAQDLRSLGDPTASGAYLAERISKGGPWTRSETNALFHAWTDALWALRDLPALEAAADAWIATRPREDEAYRVRAAVGYFRDQVEKEDRWVLDRLGAGDADLADPAARAAVVAAADVALGNGWNFWARTIPLSWRGPLAALALRGARSESRYGDLGASILQDWRFRRTEEARVLRQDLLADVAASGAVASLPLRRLARYVAWIEWGSSETPETARKAFLDGLLARWRATTDAADAEWLAGLVDVVLRATGSTADRLPFLRERLARADESEAAARAYDVFQAVLDAPHDPAREDEAFALLPRLLDPRADDEMDRGRAAAAARGLARYVYDARLEAALGTPEERARWTRAEAVAKGRAARTKARVDAAARLAAAAAAAPATARPWLEVERVGYAAESLADLARAQGEAREVLESIAVGSTSGMDRLLAERAAVVVAYTATRRAAPPALADQALTLLRARLAARDRVLDDRYQVFRLLVALDRVDDLERDLSAWATPDDVEPRWRIALAYLLAETNRVKEAAAAMEAAAALADLDAASWATLADWYLVLGDEPRREAALERQYDALGVWPLRQRLWQEANRLARTGEGVPAEMVPETLRALRALLRKDGRPADSVQHVQALYAPTKDFRVLECLADGIVGHTPEAVYGFLRAATQMLAQVHEEATCDALAARLTALASAATNDDRRGLRLLLSAVESRASQVPKADPKHAERALAALRVAFEGALVPGERVLLARHLATLGSPADPALAAEQMTRLEALLSDSRGTPERLSVGLDLARALWGRARHEDAADRLAALLEEARAPYGGWLPPEAVEANRTLLDWWTQMGRFRQAEARLRADLGLERWAERRERVRLRLFQLYAAALHDKGTLSLGSGADLFHAAAPEVERYVLTEGPAYLLGDAVEAHARLHDAGGRPSVPEAAAEYEAFVRDRLPGALARAPTESLNVLQIALGHLQNLRGPRAALAVALSQVERESPWRTRVSMDAWSRFSGSMAEWRAKAGSAGDLEPRLLAVVESRLEATLVEMSGEGGGEGFWDARYDHFWREHAADFAAVAARVAEVHAAEPEVALYVARYQRQGLDLHGPAVATLQMTAAQGKDTEEIRSTLVAWLHEDRRFAEALPIVERLVQERPDNLTYRTLSARVLHGLGRDDDALKVLEAAVARWKERKAWTMNAAAAVAVGALEADKATRAAEWIEDAMRMRREAGGRGGPDATLSSWYQTLARARSRLGDTDAAVRAAAAAVVAWGRDQENRARALGALREVLQAAKDLDAFVARYEAEVAKSGMDAPTIRKALGQVYLGGRQFSRAAAQLRVARDLDPADGEVSDLLVQALDGAGDAPGALEALLAAVRMAPKNLDAYPKLANRFHAAGDEEDAERARTGMVEAMPSEPDGYRALAGLREADGRWPAAVVAWKNVTRVRPLDPTGWLALAKGQAMAGDKDGARATLDHVLQTKWDERFGDVLGQAAAQRDALR